MERQREHERDDVAAPPGRRHEPSARPEEVPPARRRSLSFIATAVAVGLLAAGVAGWLLQPAVSGDTGLTAAEVLSRQQAFDGEGLLRLPPVPAAEVARALDALQLAAADRAALERDVASGKVGLAWMTLWDDQAEDGDFVQLDAAGFSRTIGITSAPQTIAVPLTTNSDFRLTGVRDGGGGITVAAKANGRDVALPVLAEGQAIAVRLGL